MLTLQSDNESGAKSVPRPHRGTSATYFEYIPRLETSKLSFRYLFYSISLDTTLLHFVTCFSRS